MNKFYASLLLVFLLPLLMQAQTEKYQSTSKLKHHMTDEEAKMRHLIGRDFTPTDPPPAPVQSIAEFAPQKGVLVRYPFGIPIALIKELSMGDQVTTIVADQIEENTVVSQYQSNGVNMDNCNFLHAPTDSYWTRDYGPWFILDGNNEIAIVDFPYNRPRPNDDNLPGFVADMMDVPMYGMDLIHTGGNWMCDGMGEGASTDLVWQENPTLSQQQVDNLVDDYLGVTDYHVVDDPNNTYIDHIDCWGKFLDVDKILIRAVPSSHPQYADLEDMAAYWAEQICSYGYNFNVIRVYAPDDQPYSNSLILNNKVYVPITNSQWDDDALQTYEEAMPGYTVNGFYGSWESTDALHCRTHEMADKEMLYMYHQVVYGEIPQGEPIDIECTIKALSGQSLKPDSVLVFYQVNGGSWQTTALTSAGNDQYTATIPQASNGSTVRYYLYAADESGRTTRHPFIGAADPHEFSIGAPTYPTIAVTPFMINRTCLTGNTCGGEIIVSNMGASELIFTTSIEEDAKDFLRFTLNDTPENWERNTLTEAKSSEVLVESDGQVSSLNVSFDYSVNNYPFENSVWLKAPSGKKARIANGLQNGNYSITADAFKGESMQGRWSLWIEDNYGDGGAQMTDITFSVAAQNQRDNWISVDPANGTVEPEGEMSIDYTLDATNLEEGFYTGRIIIESNDPDTPEFTLSVNFQVVEPSDLKLNPDTIWFSNREDIENGKTFYIANRDIQNHDLLAMNHEGENDVFAWAIDPWTIDLPTYIPKRDSIELTVKPGALDPWPTTTEMAYDSILVTSELSTQKLVIALDPLALYRDVVIAPDTLKFLTEESIYEGRTFTMTNPCPDSLEITNLPYLSEGQMFWIEDYPGENHFWMQASSEEEYLVRAPIAVESMVNIAYDSLMIETEAGMHKIIIQVDLDLIIGIREQEALPEFSINPNPARNIAQIQLNMKSNEHMSLDLYDNKGGFVAHIFDGMLSAGDHPIALHSESIPEGLYFLMLETASGKRTVEKVLVVK